jgi:asparagine synthase (glutamine-hydrolysing)
MSGICGIAMGDGSTVDRSLLERLVAFMRFRGPDAQRAWHANNIGLGHTALWTDERNGEAEQPLSLDGKVWITADARIDGQAELKIKLAGPQHKELDRATDAQLILHAYRTWGRDCAKHLIGDFAFAIWDGPNSRLFCARDQLGVKPFFYAPVGQHLIFSNTLDCIRQHPLVRNVLNDLAIADFLLFDMNQDCGTTAFADIQRLAPAHQLTWSPKGLEVSRYWTPPFERVVEARPDHDYVEHFRGLLATSVRDRMRTSNIAVSMSGGLDSTAVAATAKNIFAAQAAPFALHAYTVVHDRVIPDDERKFAASAALRLGIPIHYCVADNYKLYEAYLRQTPTPEPVHEPDGAVHMAALEAPAAHFRVMLTGWDGDTLLNESPKPYFRALLNERRVIELLGGIARYVISERRLLPREFRDWLKRGSAATTARSTQFPTWISPALEKQFALRARWAQVNAAAAAEHPIRPHAHGVLAYIMRMPSFFEHYDAGVTRLALECRHPLLDLRLVDFCLSLPPVPWCVRKEILRRAMRGRLPDRVRFRPKTPLRGWPGAAMIRDASAQWIDNFTPAAGLERYVIREKIPKTWGEDYPGQAWANLRPLSLNFWLQHVQSR